MPDDYSSYAGGLDSPARKGTAITPDDDGDLATATRGIWVGTGGDVAVILVGDTDPIVFVNVPNGTLLPVRAKRVRETGTDAEDLLALW